jgi:NTE family protein
MALRIVHLIYHATRRQGTTKDFEFSRLNMREHWEAGYADAVRTLRHPEALSRPTGDLLEGVGVFDVAVNGRI